MKTGLVAAYRGQVHGRLVHAKAAVGRRQLLADAAGAAFLAVLGVMAVRVGIDTAPPGYQPPPTSVWVGLTMALVLPLAWRRRFPLSVLIVVTVVFFPYRIVDIPDLTVSVVAWWLALYSAGAYGQGRWRNVVRALNVVAALGFFAYRLLISSSSYTDRSMVFRAAFFVLFDIAFVIAAWVFGNAVAQRRVYEQGLMDRAAQLEREREEKARRAVFDERVRIARELHDVVAHHVSVMGVQAGAARRVMDRHPSRAAEALQLIEDTSRQAVVELHRMLGFLRREGDPDHLTPQPRLSQLDALIEGFAKGGLDIRVQLHGGLRAVPPSLELSAYRIIQEALTNVVKHSTARHVAVDVTYEPRRLQIEVVDDGAARVDDHLPGGHGLIGMQERVALHDGELTVGVLPTGGFRVAATFPLREVMV